MILGVHLADDFSFNINTVVIVKKDQQRMHPLQRLKKADLPTSHPTTFYRHTTESIISYSLTSWFCNFKASERYHLNRMGKGASKITGASLPFLLEIFHEHCIHRAFSLIKDPQHPSYSLLSVPPSRKMYQSICARFSRMLNSSFLQEVRINGF